MVKSWANLEVADVKSIPGEDRRIGGRKRRKTKVRRGEREKGLPFL